MSTTVIYIAVIATKTGDHTFSNKDETALLEQVANWCGERSKTLSEDDDDLEVIKEYFRNSSDCFYELKTTVLANSTTAEAVMVREL